MNILIADDHTLVRKSIKAILHAQYPIANIEEAYHGPSLVEQIIRFRWDVIISDISMPGITGAGIIKKIREITPHTPLIILSGHPVSEYAIATIQMGASCYLTKETTPDELVNAVTQILNGKKYFTPEVAELLADFMSLPKRKKIA